MSYSPYSLIPSNPRGDGREGMRIFFSHKRICNSLCFIVLIKKHDWTIHESLCTWTNQDSVIFFIWENFKKFNITSKYFSIFSIEPAANWVAHIARDFITCYSCSYYSTMLQGLSFIISWTEIYHYHNMLFHFTKINFIMQQILEVFQ